MGELIGHKNTVTTLMRLAKEGSLRHGYLFAGAGMIGKRTAALSLARFLEKGEFAPPASGEVLLDATVITPGEGNAIGIDAVREIKHFLWQKPNAGARRILIIDDAELLTNEAQNALLKITEEPPASSLLILVASDPESILPTILSRLQELHFGSIPTNDITKWLVAAHGIAESKAEVFARRSLGKPGLAWRLAFDPDFQKQLLAAQDFLKAPAAARRDLIKKIIEPDNFDLRKFLDAVIIVLAWEKPSKAKMALWHKVMELYRTASRYSLNPRLQLANLLTS